MSQYVIVTAGPNVPLRSYTVDWYCTESIKVSQYEL